MMPSATTSLIRILLVEDSKGDACLTVIALSEALPQAHSVHQAATLSDALKMLAENTFDIALLDRSLPDVADYGGIDSMQRIAPKLPIIFLTAYKDEEIALHAIEHGAQDYLFKDAIDSHTIKRVIHFAIIRKQFEETFLAQANFDSLTGLVSRTLFENRLDMALAKMERLDGSLGVFLLDLDSFKHVDETFGHSISDRLLAETGKRLRQGLRPYDTAAYLGGDTFAVLIEGNADRECCTTVARKIIKLAEMPFLSSGITVGVSARIGIALCMTQRLYTRQELIVQADMAMHAAREASADGFTFSSPARDAA